MFTETLSSGKHMICDFRKIQNTELLNDPIRLKLMMKTICECFDYKILGEIKHVFTPEGCTILLLLSESHMSIHTFPERNYLAFDVYTCREYPDDYDYLKIYYYLIQELRASPETSYTMVDRHF
jgi:S-adenosylmethionine decarboxylase